MDRSEKINALKRILEGKVLGRPTPLFASLTKTEMPGQLPTYLKDGKTVSQNEYERCVENYQARKPYNTHSYQRSEKDGTITTEFLQFKDPIDFDPDQMSGEPMYRMPDGSFLVF